MLINSSTLLYNEDSGDEALGVNQAQLGTPLANATSTIVFRKTFTTKG